MNRTSLLFLFLLIVLLGSCKTTKNTTAVSTFSQVESELITSGDKKTPMRILQLTNKTDSIILRKKSLPVSFDAGDKNLQLFAERLKTTIQDSMTLGVGIAAPQVGLLKQIILVQRFDKEGFPMEIYINPVIKQYTTKTQPCMEGCLSIADKRGDSGKRAYAILIEYDKMDGTHHTEMVEDFTAVIFQHEIDHLDGILFIDHLEAESN